MSKQQKFKFSRKCYFIYFSFNFRNNTNLDAYLGFYSILTYISIINQVAPTINKSSHVFGWGEIVGSGDECILRKS